VYVCHIGYIRVFDPAVYKVGSRHRKAEKNKALKLCTFLMQYFVFKEPQLCHKQIYLYQYLAHDIPVTNSEPQQKIIVKKEAYRTMTFGHST
jgi:hypothetical protein